MYIRSHFLFTHHRFYYMDGLVVAQVCVRAHACMRVFICVYFCVHCVIACVFVCVCVCLCLSSCTGRSHVFGCVCVYERECVCVNTHAHVWVWVCTCVSVYAYMYIGCVGCETMTCMLPCRSTHLYVQHAYINVYMNTEYDVMTYMITCRRLQINVYI